MARVKGSPKRRVKVVEYRLRIVVGILAALVLAVAGLAAAAYFGGHKVGMSGQERAKEDVQRLSTELAQWKSSAQEYEQLLENSNTAAEIDRQSSEGVRQEVISLKDEIARLSEENTFYRGLMAPNEKASGLTIGSVELVRSRDSETYNYKVVVQQLATRHSVLSGVLTFTVFGRQDGIETRYPLMDLSNDVSVEDVRLRFKYFQVIEGQLGLPENFEPEGIEISARTTGAKVQKVDKKFGWLVEEL